MSRSTYNLKIDTISTYDIPLDRTFLKLSNGIRHVMPSTDRRLELKEKTSMAQTVWQPAVYAKGLTTHPHLALRAFIACSGVTLLLPFYKLSYMEVGLQAGCMEIMVHDDDFEVVAVLRFHHLRINFVEPNNNHKSAL